MARSAVYKQFEQAESNAGEHVPLLVIRADRKEALTILRLDDFMELVGANDNSRPKGSTKNRKRPAR